MINCLECCKQHEHAVGVCDDGGKGGAVSDGAGGGTGAGGDIRGVHLAGYCKHAVGVCDVQRLSHLDRSTGHVIARGRTCCPQWSTICTFIHTILATVLESPSESILGIVI